jgi:hypothetical protein
VCPRSRRPRASRSTPRRPVAVSRSEAAWCLSVMPLFVPLFEEAALAYDRAACMGTWGQEETELREHRGRSGGSSSSASRAQSAPAYKALLRGFLAHPAHRPRPSNKEKPNRRTWHIKFPTRSPNTATFNADDMARYGPPNTTCPPQPGTSQHTIAPWYSTPRPWPSATPQPGQ